MADRRRVPRHYTNVSVVARPHGYSVVLDNKELKTPAGSMVGVPWRPLAEAIAGEWDSQPEFIDPPSMPMMRIAATVLDRVDAVRIDIVEGTLKYAEADLICYRAAAPPDLCNRQDKLWQPHLDWAAAEFGAPLNVGNGIMPVGQPADSLIALRRLVEGFDPYRLAALSLATAASGSLVLGLALLLRRIDAAAAADAALLDNEFQMEIWGRDEEAWSAMQQIRRELRETERFVELLAD